jgi:hypothetical protein
MSSVSEPRAGDKILISVAKRVNDEEKIGATFSGADLTNCLFLPYSAFESR